jgi:M6 family metalloprotease-like protein
MSHSGAHRALTSVVTASLVVIGLATLGPPTHAAVAAPAPKPATKPATTGYAGAPVNPAPYTITQPDGSTFRAFRFGDRLSNGVATVKGKNTIVQGRDGYWRYGDGLDTSGDVKASSIVAGRGKAPAAARGLRPEPRVEPAAPAAPMAGTGVDTELVILVDFTDSPSHTTQAEWASEYFGPTGSVNAFYDEASGGQYGLEPAQESSGTGGDLNNGVVGWIDLSYPHPDTGVTSARDDYVADAITAASDYVDFAAYDANSDGEITTDELHVTVIGAGFETSYGGAGNVCGGKSIWGHQYDLVSQGINAPTVDGVTVGDSGYTTFGEMHCEGPDASSAPGHKATMGIMAHEFGHDINWPDLYDVDYSSDGIGEWSLMAGGSWGRASTADFYGSSPAHPDAWALYYQGWVVPTEITAATDDLSVSVGESFLLSPNPGGSDWEFSKHTGTGEYFLVENRQREGFDRSIPGCGLVVYRIDETVSSNNDANSDYVDPLVKLVQADGNDDLAQQGDRGDAGDAFPGTSGNHDLGDTTNPNTRFHDGTASNLSLHVDSTTCSETMQLDVLRPGDASPVVVAPDNDMFADAHPLTGAHGVHEQSTKLATTETDEPVPAGCGTASVWFAWIAPASGRLQLTTMGSAYDTVLGVYTGTTVDGLTEVATNDDEDYDGGVYTSVVAPDVLGGTTYRIAADGCAGSKGDLRLAWDLVSESDIAAVHTPEPSTYGSASSVNVTVSGTNGTPTGAVTLMEGATTVGAAVPLDGAGKATFSLPATLAVGSHSLTVSYSGDASYDPGTKNITATVAVANPTVTAVRTPAPSTYGSASSVDVTVAGVSGGATPSGQVTLMEGAATIGAAATLDGSGTASITLPATYPAGSHSLTVSYAGDSRYAAATSVLSATVTAVTPTVTAQHAPAPSTYGSASSVDVTVAGITGGATPSGQVTLQEGSTTIGAAVTLDGSGKTSITLPATYPVGSHTLTVSYAGDSSYAAATSALGATVTAATPTVTAQHAPTPSTYGSASAVNVTVAGVTGGAMPSGQVTLMEGAAALGSATLNGGTATIALPPTMTVGTHDLTVSYTGSTAYRPAAGNVTVRVTAAASTTTAKAPRKVKFKKNFSVVAMVTPATAVGTGTVEIYDRGKVIGSGTLASDGTVSIKVKKNLKGGKHLLTVKYRGSTTASASETTVKVEVVKQKPKRG